MVGAKQKMNIKGRPEDPPSYFLSYRGLGSSPFFSPSVA
jgi:hypothetical protein